MAQSPTTFELVVLFGPLMGHRRMLSTTSRLMIGRRVFTNDNNYLSFPVPRRYQFSLRYDHELQQFLFLNNSVLDITRINGELIEPEVACPLADRDIIEVEYQWMISHTAVKYETKYVRLGFSAVE